MTSMAAIVPMAQAPRWSVWKVLNIACGTVIAWAVLWTAIGVFWRVGIDPQNTRCLPWVVYLVSQSPPQTIVKGKTYQYRSRQIGTLIADGTRIVKIVAGVPGDRVIVNSTGIWINGRFWGPLNGEVMRKAHLTIADLDRDVVIPKGKLLVLGTLPRSYDSRYWGLIDQSQLAGRAYPVW